MTGLRHILILLMAALIGLTPAKALEMPVTVGLYSAVICSGDTTKTVTLDQDGNPASPHHICLDCCLSVDLPGPAPDLARRFVPFELAQNVETGTSVWFQRPFSSPPATGPPILI